MAKKKWSEMSAGQRALVVGLGTTEFVLTSVAAIDLARRPAALVHGNKVAWALALVVQPVGPIAYLWVHRR